MSVSVLSDLLIINSYFRNYSGSYMHTAPHAVLSPPSAQGHLSVCTV